jgi:hypothetical protein
MKDAISSTGILNHHVSPFLPENPVTKPFPAHSRDIHLSRFLEKGGTKKKSNNRHRHRNRQSIHQRALTSRAQTQLKNSGSPPPTLGKKCDPLSHNPDTGILSCGHGYECIVNNKEEPLQEHLGEGGGVCVLSIRELQQQQQQQGVACNLCDYGFTVGDEFLDVSVGIPLPGYDGTTCGTLITAAYVERTVSSEACPVVTDAAQASGCCAPMCDLCGPGWYVSDAKVANAVTVSQLEGYSNETCGSIYSAAYYYATFDSQTCSVIRQAVIDSGCCDTTQCNACGPEEYIVDSYSSGTTCGDLRNTVYAVGNLTEDQCTSSIQLAQDESCCVPPPVYDCNICGDGGVDYPNNWIYKLGTCEFGQSLLNETQCDKFGDILVPWCCAPSDESTVEPGSPTASPEEEEEEGPPKSASVRMSPPWVTRVSLISLAVATAAGSVLVFH